MNEILKMLNTLSADELDNLIVRAGIMLEKKRKDEAAQAVLEKERRRQEEIDKEKRRLEEIAELQRKLNELQSQITNISAEPAAPAEQPAAAQPQPAQPQQPVQAQPAQISCPHCHQTNAADTVYCSNCGQKMKTSHPVPQPAPAPEAQPAAQPQANAAQVRYADESMEEWKALPGEITEWKHHEITFYEPVKSGTQKYFMEVTNQRILFSQQSAIAANAGVAFGLVGALVREIADAGPKPWLEIPLTAVKNCGLRNKKEFFIEADKTYVMKNKKYDDFLPQLIANAKRNGN